jgi:hypothetical protein
MSGKLRPGLASEGTNSYAYPASPRVFSILMTFAVSLPVWKKVCPRRLVARILPVLIAAGALLASTVAGRAGSVDDLDRDNGLPDAKLGAPLKSFKGLQLVENTGRWLTYRVPGDNLKFLGTEVSSIKLNFFKEQLYSIDINFESKATTRRLLKTFEQMYGTKHTFETRKMLEASTELETREWTGTKAYLVFKKAGDNRGGVAIYVDRPLWDQLAQPREERAAQTRKMLDGSYTHGDF